MSKLSKEQLDLLAGKIVPKFTITDRVSRKKVEVEVHENSILVKIENKMVHIAQDQVDAFIDAVKHSMAYFKDLRKMELAELVHADSVMVVEKKEVKEEKKEEPAKEEPICYIHEEDDGLIIQLDHVVEILASEFVVNNSHTLVKYDERVSAEKAVVIGLNKVDKLVKIRMLGEQFKGQTLLVYGDWLTFIAAKLEEKKEDKNEQ